MAKDKLLTMLVWFPPLSTLLFPVLFPERGLTLYRLHPWLSFAIYLSLRSSQRPKIEQDKRGRR